MMLFEVRRKNHFYCNGGFVQRCVVIWISKDEVILTLKLFQNPVLLRYQNQRTASPGYFKTLKDPAVFMKESTFILRQ